MSTRAATMATVVALLAAALAAAAPAAAAPSDLDTAFGTGGIALQAGIQTGALAVAAAPGGKIVVAGTDTSDGQKIAVARFGPTGQLDPTFSPAGTPGIASVAVGDNDADAEAVAVDGQGRVVVVGSAVSAGQPAIAVIRLTAGGAVDTSWDAAGAAAAHQGIALVAGGAAAQGAAVALTPGDDVVVAGREQIGTAPQQRILLLRLTAGGAADGAFGSSTPLTAGSAYPHAVVRDPGGGFYVTGTYIANSSRQVFVARYGANGTLDPTFGAAGAPAGTVLTALGTSPDAWDLGVEADGRPVIAGASDAGAAARPFAARYTTSGALDPGFAPGQPRPGLLELPSEAAFTAIARQLDGSWVLAGGTATAFFAARVTDAGVPDTSFSADGTVSTPAGRGGFAQAEGVLVAGDGGIVAGGVADDGDATKIALVRYVGDAPAAAGGTGPGPVPVEVPPAPKIAVTGPSAKGTRLELTGGGSSPGSAAISAYNWDFNGDGRYDGHCPATDPIGLHAYPRAGRHTVGLQVVATDGLAATTTVQVTTATGTGGPASNPRAVAEDGYACAGVGPNDRTCVDRVDLDGQDVRALRGSCFVEKPIPKSDPLNQIGPVGRAADRTDLGRWDPSIVRKIRGKLWTTTGRFVVNGLEFQPDPSRPALIDERNNLLAVPQPAVTIYKTGLALSRDRDVVRTFKDVTNRLQALELPDFPDVSQYLPKLFDFPLTGSVTPKLVDGKLELVAHMKLPAVLGGLTADVTLVADSDLGLHLDDIAAGAAEIPLGLIDLRDVKFSYSASADSWEGSVCIVLAKTLAPCGTIGFKHGNFDHAEAALPVDGLGAPLAPPLLYVNRIAIGMTVGPPATVTGSVRLTAGGQLHVLGAERSVAALDGSVTLTASDPWKLEARGNLEIVGFPVADAFVRFVSSGALTFGGNASASLGPLSFSGHVEGYVYGLDDFQTDAEINACVGICAGAEVVVSSKGAGACLDLFDSWHPGGGVFWDGRVVFMADSCDIAQFRVAPKSRARAAGADGTAIDVGAGLPGEVFAIQGVDAPPNATVTAPDGTAYASPDGASVQNSRYAWFRRAETNTTYVLVPSPAAGTWHVSTDRAGADIAAVQTADGIAPPDVKATVGGHGHARTLTYRIAPQPGQKVTFFENGPGAARRIGAAHGRAGTLRFAPAPGPAGPRSIAAFVERGGLPRARLTVAHYVAPAPLRPGSPPYVRLTRHGRTLRIAWGGARRATAYRIDVHVGDGRHVRLTTDARTRRLTVRNVGPSYGATVAVAGTLGSGRAGPATHGRLRARSARRSAERTR